MVMVASKMFKLDLIK